MEGQPQVADVQAVSYLHAGGELLAADNLEAARVLCPVLGIMSLEEAGLLLELETMGNEQIAGQQKALQEKPAIEKVEKTQPVHDEAERASGPGTEEASSKIFAEDEVSTRPIPEPIAEETRDRTADEPAETVRPAIDNNKVEVYEETGAARLEEERLARTTYRPPDAREVQRQAGVEAEVAVPKSELPESFGKETDAGVIGLAETGIIEADSLDGDYKLFKIDEAVSFLDGFEQIGPDYNGEEESLARPAGTRSLDEKEPVEFGQMEARSIMAIPELPSPLAEIENTITKLVEAVEKDETSDSQKAAGIIEEIIRLPATFEIASPEQTEELEKKLEELFVELFTEVDLGCTPELIRSFVKLTKAQYLEELLSITVSADEEVQEVYAEIGTREFLQKLQHGLSAMRRVVIDFYEIGKSILRLYSASFEMAAIQA